MNSNPQAIAFSNARIRIMADLLGSAYLSAKKLLAEWNAQGVAAVIPNDATVIDDGAAADGRPIVTDAAATAIVTRCLELVNWMETGQIAAGGTVTDATLNTVVACAVNSRSYF